MIVHAVRYQKRLTEEFAVENDLPLWLIPPDEASANSLSASIRVAETNGLPYFLDLQWHRGTDDDAEWLEDEFRHPRDSIMRSEARRRQFFRAIGERYDSRYLLAPSGEINDTQASRLYAQEAAQVANSRLGGRPVAATFVVSKLGLMNNEIVSGVLPSPGVTAIVLCVADAASYPSVWTEDEWYSWLKLIGTLADAGWEVLLPYSDFRGLVALGVGAANFGSGAKHGVRQLPVDPGAGQGGGGGTATVSYASAPLLAAIHGGNASVIGAGPALESHRMSLPGVQLAGLPESDDETFDPEWACAGQGVGVTNATRIRHHLRVLSATETAIRTAANPADLVESFLAHANETADGLPADVFRQAGTQGEIEHRLLAYRRVRAELQI